MATINKNTIINNGFTVGLNVPSALGLDGGADGSYIIAANQIAWGNNSTFNGKKFGNTTAELLTAIEDAIDEVVTEVSSAVPTLTVTAINHTLQWNTAVEVAKINNQSITVKLPANPNTNTDTKVTSVGNHYKTDSFTALPIVTTEALYTIKTDAAGHITNATKVNLNNYASKSEYNDLLQEFNELKELIGWNV